MRKFTAMFTLVVALSGGLVTSVSAQEALHGVLVQNQGQSVGQVDVMTGATMVLNVIPQDIDGQIFGEYEAGDGYLTFPDVTFFLVRESGGAIYAADRFIDGPWGGIRVGRNQSNRLYIHLSDAGGRTDTSYIAPGSYDFWVYAVADQYSVPLPATVTTEDYPYFPSAVGVPFTVNVLGEEDVVDEEVVLYEEEIIYQEENIVYEEMEVAPESPEYEVTPYEVTPVVAPIQEPLLDVPAGAWYYDYVGEALQLGLILPAAPGYFQPHAALERQELAQFWATLSGGADALDTEEPYSTFNRLDLAHYLYWRGIELNIGFYAGDEFTDIADPVVEALVGSGIIHGRSATIFDPYSNVTRAEAAAMFVRFAGLLN